MIRKNIVLILLLWFSTGLFAQEYLTGLHSNPLVSSNKNLPVLKTTNDRVRLHLPFLDDFSYKGQVYPADTLWGDRKAFINSTYCINPPTVGVATLDAINDTGAIYQSATPTPFQADYLTSRPIRLDTLFNGSPTPISAGDSLYLSFYYQPQGVADAPEAGDSLILDFFAPDLNKWIKVWGSGGLPYASFKALYNRDFKQVMIPIKQPQYLKNSFQFRFRNYSSIAPIMYPSWQSNCDQWNIDYVYLNAGRTKADTMPQDISFVDPAPTFLKNYQQIPARQFTGADVAKNVKMKESNLYKDLTNTTYGYVVTQENGSFSYTYTGGVIDYYPFLPNGYVNYPPHSFPPTDSLSIKLPPLFGSNDSMVFNFTHIMHSNAFTDKNSKNDTIVHRQEFNNAYAYDDGTAENGYGLSVQNSKVAYEFTINHPDTLGGVAMFFNETYSNPLFKYFYIMVWSSRSPETLIYKSKRQRPEFADSINKYYFFPITDQVVLVGGTFYVGWLQTTEDNLNVGLDRNNDSKIHTYYNVDGTWQTSSISGSLMIRPLMGKAWQSSLTGIKEISKENFGCLVFPNPASGNTVNISIPAKYNTDENRRNTTIEVYDYLGRTLMEQPYSDKLDISSLGNGMYLVRLINNLSNNIFTGKFIVTR